MTVRDENIAWTLTDRAASDPGLTALFEPKSGRNPEHRSYSSMSFAELEAYSNRLAHAMHLSGMVPGTRAVLMVTPSRAFFGLTFAVFKAGVVPVFIDPGMGIRGLGKCIADSGATAFIGIPKAHIARRLFGWGSGRLNRFVMVKGANRFLTWQDRDTKRSIDVASLPENPPIVSVDSGSTAAVLFTSGSTGPAKGVVYTHRIFNAQVNALSELFGIRPGEVDLCTFPLFALFAPALGMTSVIPRMDFTRPGRVDPREIVAPCVRFQVTNLFGSPALLRRVGRFGVDHGICLPSLERVVSAGAPVPANVIFDVKSMLREEAQVFTPYGATESLPVSCIGSDQILGETATATAQGKGVCVGRPVPGMNAKIIRVTDEPISHWDDSMELPVGEVGEIVVSADQVTQNYDSRPDADSVSKIRDSTVDPPRNRHRMGDLGYFDHQGRLWFCGRKAHRVWTDTGPLDTIPTEAVFNEHPDVFRTALVGFGAKPNQTPVLCVELKPGRKDWRRIESELRSIALKNERLSGISHFLKHPAFPVDIRHNSKIFREKLAVWAARRLSR